jgi:dynein heavy chain
MQLQTAQAIAVQSEKPWNFETSNIFAQIDAFLQRCRDLLEICEGQIQFARKWKRDEKV